MAASENHPRRVLFTAFEPSGDALAAPMIARLLELDPNLEIWAMGGPKMSAAGARLLETTTDHAKMLLGAASHAMTHRNRVQRLDAWLADHEPAALVAVDSPAANWSICKRVRRKHPRAKVVHLAAPQLWAWAPWRIGKLRRLTDLVLCLLPFEPQWFAQRGVRATFVGHPLFDPPPDTSKLAIDVAKLPQEGRPKIALLPGSRPGEVHANWPTMLHAYTSLQKRKPELRGLVAVGDEPTRALVERISEALPGVRKWPASLRIVSGQTDAALAWADLALVVSGTATLQCAAHRTPMVVYYNIGSWSWRLLGRWLVRTRTFALPNLIAPSDGGKHPIPELVPHFGIPEPIVEQLDRLLRDPHAVQTQQAAFDTIAQAYANQSYSDNAARKLLETISTDISSPSSPPTGI